MTKNCAYCKHGEEEINFMIKCRCLGHSVVANRTNKVIHKNELCRAEELSKGTFEVDKIKFNKYKLKSK